MSVNISLESRNGILIKRTCSYLYINNPILLLSLLLQRFVLATNKLTSLYHMSNTSQAFECSTNILQIVFDVHVQML